MEVEALSTMLTNITTIITSIFTWVGTACSTIISTPLLIVGLAFFCLGGAIGIIGRLLSRN